MTNFVPLKKQSKKKQKEYYLQYRNIWCVDPITKVIPNKKVYDRKKLSKKFDSFCCIY